MSKKKPLSPELREECEAAHRIFLEKRKELALSQKKVADAAGISAPGVNLYFKGINALNLPFATVLSELLGVPIDSFSPRLAEEARTVASALKKTRGAGGPPSVEDHVLIPHYDAKAACGDGYLNDHVEVNGSLAFRRDWIKSLGCKADDLYVIYAQGASMEPYIFEGDIVLIDTSSVEPADRHVYALRRPSGEVSIKRMIQQISGAWLVRSDNPDKSTYPDEPVTDAVLHEIPILGRVIWRGGRVG